MKSIIFDKHLTEVRKDKNISQDEVSKIIGVHCAAIGIYERDEVKPSIEVAIKIADALQVSLDYLIRKTSLEVDSNTLKRIEEISNLSKSAKEQIYLVIDALVRDFKAKQAYS